MKINNIYIFTDEPFPMGMAGTNRIISYAKGFLAHDKQVEVVCFRKTEQRNNIQNRSTRGVFEGVSFRYLNSNTVISKLFIKRRIDEFYAFIKLIFYGAKNFNSNSLLLYYGGHTIPAFLLHLLASLKGGVLIKEETEHPEVRIKIKNFIERMLFKKVHYDLFDGYFLITETLIDYFKDKISKNKPILHVPMMIDLDRFKKRGKKNDKIKQIVYCGAIAIEKDGVDLLIKAFKKITDHYDNYILSLYGLANTDGDLNEISFLINELHLEDKIMFYGYVNREIITEKILEADILTLPRPDSLQARHGFSTKLGEYLATGNPVLATSVGEIPRYLTDCKDVFMALPGDVDSLQIKLKYIIENYDFAKEVGERGRQFAENHFNNVTHTAKALSFIERVF